MPYEHTHLPPSFAKVLETGNPKHCCRPPQRSRRNTHTHTYIPGPGSTVVLQRHNPVHNSDDTYYYVADARTCNTTVLPALAPCIEWKYDTSSRQCARPYVPAPRNAQRTNIVKVSRRPGRLPVAFAVHPECWERILDEGSREIPGDVIALLCRLGDEEREEEIEALRGNAPICCYFSKN